MKPRKKDGNQRDPTYKDTLLSSDPNLKRWYNNTKHGSIITAEVGLQRIGRTCKLFNTTPAKLAKMEVKEATDFLLDLVTQLHDEGKQPRYIENFVKVLKSWFKYSGIKIEQKIKIPENGKKPSRVEQEISPTTDQLRKALNAADLKQKVESIAIGFSGLRIETIGDYQGNDGLKVKDLPEMTVDNKNKTVEFTKIPTQVIVRHNLSKAGHQYFSFMPDEGSEYVKALLELRMKDGEVLSPESPIVTSLKWHKDSLKKESVDHITSRKVGSSIKVAIKKAGFDWRPYILRTYFDTRMMLAEHDGLIIRDWRVFWMGHKGDIEHVYTLNKRLPPDVIEKMRSSFAKAADKYLVTTVKHDKSIDAMKAEWRREQLEWSNVPEDVINKLGDLALLSKEDMKKIIDQYRQESSKRSLGLNRNSQKVIPMGEVKQYITQGWEYVKDLPTNEAIVKLPAS